VSAEGKANVLVEVSPGNSLYVVVKYRNHLAAMSSEPLVFSNLLTSFDFTTGPGKYMGGTNACVELEPGVWGMVAGDADGDGKVTDVDRLIVSNSLGKTGYLNADLNLDGIVNGND